MITARSSVVKIPPGKYTLVEVLRPLIEGYAELNLPKRPVKKPRPERKRWNKVRRGCAVICLTNKMLAFEWQERMKEKDPDGLQELWTR